LVCVPLLVAKIPYRSEVAEERVMIVGTFPRVLSACISEARPPQPEELASLTDKVWREVFVDGAARREDAATIARAAFFGGDVDPNGARGGRQI
jgi:hypothetical protein